METCLDLWQNSDICCWNAHVSERLLDLSQHPVALQALQSLHSEQ